MAARADRLPLDVFAYAGDGVLFGRSHVEADGMAGGIRVRLSPKPIFGKAWHTTSRSGGLWSSTALATRRWRAMRPSTALISAVGIVDAQA